MAEERFFVHGIMSDSLCVFTKYEQRFESRFYSTTLESEHTCDPDLGKSNDPSLKTGKRFLGQEIIRALPRKTKYLRREKSFQSSFTISLSI